VTQGDAGSTYPPRSPITHGDPTKASRRVTRRTEPGDDLVVEVNVIVPASAVGIIAAQVAAIVTADLGMATIADASPYMTVADAAEYLHWTKDAIYKLTAADAIPHFRPHGDRILFRREDLDRWVERAPHGARSVRPAHLTRER